MNAEIYKKFCRNFYIRENDDYKTVFLKIHDSIINKSMLNQSQKNQLYNFNFNEHINVICDFTEHMKNELNHYKINELQIYGGATEKTMNEKRVLHIINECSEIDATFDWIELSSYEIKDKNIHINVYKCINDIIETFLIYDLYKKFGDNCINKTMFGGGGLKEKYDDIVKFYIMFSVN